MKKLKDTSESLRTFLSNANALKEKLGSLYFFNFHLAENTERLSDFLKKLPKGYAMFNDQPGNVLSKTKNKE
jgi:hypothetical protein